MPNSQDYRQSQDSIKYFHTLNFITKEIHSFVQSKGEIGDKAKYEFEDKMYLSLVIELFRRLGNLISKDEAESIALFVNNEDRTEKLQKMIFILDKHSEKFPILIRELALEIDGFLQADPKVDTFPLYETLTLYANELEKANRAIFK